MFGSLSGEDVEEMEIGDSWNGNPPINDVPKAL